MSFEETLKTSYSHGLESIYKLETVDLRTVRRLNVSIAETIPKEVQLPVRALSPQLEIDFGACFRDWMVPTLFEEPIQVLSLNRHAEKSLLEVGRTHLKDLVDLKNLRQGHRDEILSKFESYLKGKERDRAYRLDFASWLRALCPVDQRMRCHLFLECFGLEELLPLGMSEGAEVRRLTKEQKEQWKGEGALFFNKKTVQSFVKECVEVFLRPWILRRKGLATEEELVERLEKCSGGCVEKILCFLQSIQCHPAQFLHEAAPAIYAATSWQAEAFEQVVACAKSYFCSPAQIFLLPHLVSLVEREKARFWMGYEEGFVEKALRLSPRFTLCKRNIRLSKPFNANATGIAEPARFAR